MPQRFIVAGPIDGLYHVLYKVPGTLVYSSVGCCSHEELALEEARILNEKQVEQDNAIGEKF